MVLIVSVSVRIPLQETDEIVNSVCALATYYERRGFTEGIKTGIRLGIEEGIIE